MADYSLANLLKAQMLLKAEFGSNDQRYREPEIFKSFIVGAERFFPNYKELRKSEKRPLELNYFKKVTQTLLTSREHNHTGTGGDSGVLTPSWETAALTFSMTLKQADSSVYSWQDEFNDNIRNKVIDFANVLDTKAGLYLFNNRTGVNTAAVKGTFNATNDVYEVPAANKDDIGTIMKLVMDINKYQNSQIRVICDSIMYADVIKVSNQGAGNATNTAFQFMGITFVHDAQMTARSVGLAAGYNKGFGIATAVNRLAVLDWIPMVNRRGYSDSEGTYGNLLNPVDGLLYASHSYSARADGTSRNGEKQDVLFETELSIDLSFNHAPSSVANETCNFAFAIV